MAAVTLDEVKLYLRVDCDEEDTTIAVLMEAATALIKEQAGKNKKVLSVNGEVIESPLEDLPLFQTCVKQLVAHWFERRGAQGLQQQSLPFSVDMIIDHFKLSYDYQ